MPQQVFIYTPEEHQARQDRDNEMTWARNELAVKVKQVVEWIDDDRFDAIALAHKIRGYRAAMQAALERSMNLDLG